MKIGIFDPYIDALGGGERYCLSAAEHLSQNNEVSVFWNDKSQKQKAENFINLDLSKVKFVENPFAKGISFAKKFLILRNYDLTLFVSDGSIPFPLSKRTILHFQVPFNVQHKSLANKIKLNLIEKIICNSFFTQKTVNKNYSIKKDKSVVVYPPVDIEKFFNNIEKENIILTVGRFSGALHAKKQEVLVKNFKEMVDFGLKDWKLIVVGGVRKGDENIVADLINSSKGYPIEIMANIDFTRLQELYRQAKIYWHATGFGEDLEKNPEKAEHFGISTVEAMSAGCVPVVIKAGGQIEIIENSKNGFLWDTLEDLKSMTLSLINDENKRKKIAFLAIERSKDFSKSVFCKKIDEIINKS